MGAAQALCIQLNDPEEDDEEDEEEVDLNDYEDYDEVEYEDKDYRINFEEDEEY